MTLDEGIKKVLQYTFGQSSHIQDNPYLVDPSTVNLDDTNDLLKILILRTYLLNGQFQELVNAQAGVQQFLGNYMEKSKNILDVVDKEARDMKESDPWKYEE